MALACRTPGDGENAKLLQGTGSKPKSPTLTFSLP